MASKKKLAAAAEEPAEAAAPEMPPGLVMEAWPIDRLVPYVRNPRAHAPETVARMAGAIREFGFKLPVLALSDGTLVDGHLRLEAARQLGLATLPVVLADDLTPAQVKAFRILSRNSAAWSPWDDGLLRLELADLRDAGFDLDLTGFAIGELEAIDLGAGAEGDADADGEGEGEGKPAGHLLALSEIAIGPPQTEVQPGEVWALRHHTLCCCDVHEDWQMWRTFLSHPDDLFCPYPGIWLPLGEKAETRRMVLVQPSTFLAGHIIDRYREINGADSVKRIQP